MLAKRIKITLAAALFAVSLGLAGFTPPAAATENTGPSQGVERLNDVLLEVMQNADDLGFQGRYDRLAPELTELFDFALMARTSIGRAWSKLEPAQQEALTDAFANLSIATFANRFSGYSGESFTVTGETPGRAGTVMVENHLTTGDGQQIPINYLIRENDGRWQIVDVLLDGKISELATKRSEYTSVLQNQGFDQLVDSLNQKAAQMATN